MAGEQEIKNPEAKSPLLKVFNCPSCGAGVTLRAAGHSVTAICGSCAAVIDSANENYRVIDTVSKAMKRVPRIKIGQRGTLKGVLWEVIGYVERVDGTGVYYWSEYLLFNPMRGFRWLTETNGHWNYVLMTKEKPTLDSGNGLGDYGRSLAKYLNKTYYLFNRGSAKISYVIGEFYWQVRKDEKVKVEEYICPPEILTCEKKDDEVVWSVGEYVDVATIQSAFQITEAWPVQLGVAPNQFSKASAAAAHLTKFWGLFVSVLVLVQFAHLIMAKNETVYSGTYTFTSMDTERIRVSPPFELKNGDANIEVTMSAPVQNNWLELQTDLVNDDEGGAVEFEQGVEYYSGYDSDGSWTEGSQSSTTGLSTIPAGKYHLNIEASGPALPNQIVTAATDITEVKTPAEAVLKTENWPNGKVKSIEPFVGQKIEGVGKYYHDNGELYAEIPWLHGQRHGRFKLYRPDGSLEQELSYKNGQLHGISKWYDANGNFERMDAYRDGVQTSSTSGPGGELPMSVNLVVKRDVVTWSNFLWALLLISVFPLIVGWRSRSFEMSRWSESDFSPYSEHKEES